MSASATLRDRPVLPGPASGGVPARRAVARWAWRLLRREWRQQILVLALLTVTVAAAAFSVSAAYNVASLPGPQFGSANHLLQFDGTNPKTLAADIAAARKAFGTIQVIGRRFVPIPGSTQTIEFRAEDPHGPYSGPMLALSQGHYPARAGQVAVTGQLAQTLRLHIGSRLSLGGQHQSVTGIVENPSDLSDQFALVSPSGAGPPQSVTVLLNAGPASFGAFLTGFRGPLVSQARGASTRQLSRQLRSLLSRSCCCWSAWSPPRASPLSPPAASASSACSPPSGRRASSFGWSWSPAEPPWASSPPSPGPSPAWRRGLPPPRASARSPATGSTGSRSRGT
jgi:putative ABC transport system permease protein